MRVFLPTPLDGLLDQALLPGCVRLTLTQAVAVPIRDEQFFQRSLDPWLVLNYLRSVGPKQVVRKVRSRRAEGLRNQRYVVAGIGKVLESLDGEHEPGEFVAFVVPDSGPPTERYVVPRSMLAPAAPPDSLPENGFILLSWLSDADQIPALEHAKAWSPHSGTVPPLQDAELEQVVAGILSMRSYSRFRGSSDPIVSSAPPARTGGATIFGYGNYVKTMVIPEVSRFFPITRIHEIDPWQIGNARNASWSWDTSPSFGKSEPADVVVIAGYHHHHVPLALEAIGRNARAVIIEKPIATIPNDLKDLTTAMEGADTAVFCAFQRRYSPFNRFVCRDLDIVPGDPIDYLATVYEAQLPKLHWYNWPNSQSRIISNGCHWIDHFLFLNDFSPLRNVRAVRHDQETTAVSLSLENGAVLVLTLTSRGSSRLGVRDHCELRANGRTITITDSTRYRAESSSRPLRYRRAHPYASHQSMYRSFGTRITSGAPGDSVSSVWASSNAILQAEQSLACM